MNKKAKIVFCFIIFLPLVFSFVTIGIGEIYSEETSKKQLTFMTYNIHFGVGGGDDLLNLERMAQNIKIDNPDIIALQEVDVARVTSGGIDMAFWLAKRLDMYYYYYNPVNNKHLMGNAILSKYPIISANGYEIPSELQERVFVHCVIEISSSLKLDVFSVHLGIRSENKYVQVEFLVNKINEISTSSQQVLMGDFNLRRTSPEINPVFKYFTEAGTIVTEDKRASIDLIFVRGHKRIADYRVITDMIPNIDTPAEYGSDHKPVTAWIEFL